MAVTQHIDIIVTGGENCGNLGREVGRRKADSTHKHSLMGFAMVDLMITGAPISAVALHRQRLCNPYRKCISEKWIDNHSTVVRALIHL